MGGRHRGGHRRTHGRNRGRVANRARRVPQRSTHDQGADPGVPLGQTFEAVIASTGNTVFQRGLTTVRDQMTSGEGFAGPLIRTRLFPPMLTQMVRVGEETGTLDTYLEQAADFYEEELDYRIRTMTSLIEPVMTVAVGLVVGFIAVSLISAMYGLVGAIK
ncbi:MAG: hypothetical protein E6I25_04940 [Chloroflexi bacterium]|nr:MAG: hypothetical protein E6I25_04940 [Chloroflexota bacterium]